MKLVMFGKDLSNVHGLCFMEFNWSYYLSLDKKVLENSVLCTSLPGVKLPLSSTVCFIPNTRIRSTFSGRLIWARGMLPESMALYRKERRTGVALCLLSFSPGYGIMFSLPMLFASIKSYWELSPKFMLTYVFLACVVRITSIKSYWELSLSLC